MLKRIAVYLNEMFPFTSFAGSVLTAVAVQLTYLRLYNERPSSYFPLILAGLVITFVSLLIRIMDEFKDYQDDLINFPDRPLPRGRVKKQDLIFLGYVCAFLIVFLSLTSLKLVTWSLITLLYTFLMLKWFFIEKTMRKNLPLAFITHHPIVLFNFMYLIISCTQMNPNITLEKYCYILPICLIFTNWEIVRKIRAPEQETPYTTYSKIFGPRNAVMIAIFLQFIFIASTYVILEKLNSSSALKIIFLVIQLVLISPSVRFLFKLKLPRPLKPIAEAQILSVVLTLLIAALL